MWTENPRNWKWMAPGAGAFVLMAFAWWLLKSYGGNASLLVTLQCVAASLVAIAVVCLIQAVAMYRAYYRGLAVADLERQQKALAISADSVRMQAANGVHPEVLELLVRDRARRWMLKSGTQSKSRRAYSILFARPNVTEAFVVHFLKMSNKKTYMPISMLSEGDKSWDPDGIVSSREMYDALESLLHEEGKATRPMGKYKPGWWVSDWDPESVAADYGLDLESWDYETEVKEEGEAKGKQKEMDPIAAALSDLEQTAWMKQMIQSKK